MGDSDVSINAFFTQIAVHLSNVVFLFDLFRGIIVILSMKIAIIAMKIAIIAMKNAVLARVFVDMTKVESFDEFDGGKNLVSLWRFDLYWNCIFDRIFLVSKRGAEKNGSVSIEYAILIG